MSRRFLVAAVVAAVAVGAVQFAAQAKESDAATLAKAKEAVRADLKEKKFFYYHDLSYFVDAPKLKESRWDWKDPPHSGATEEEGLEFNADWADKVGAEPGIAVRVTKNPHFKRQGGMQTNYSMPFKAIGDTVPLSKVDDIAAGLYKEFVASSTDVIKDKCSAAKKKKTGPAEYYATAVATDKETKKRIRMEWYVWSTSSGTPCTWIAHVTIAEKFIDTPEILQKAEDLMKATKEIADKRLK